MEPRLRKNRRGLIKKEPKTQKRIEISSDRDIEKKKISGKEDDADRYNRRKGGIHIFAERAAVVGSGKMVFVKNRSKKRKKNEYPEKKESQKANLFPHVFILSSGKTLSS